ncbi:CRAL-TRIO domain-containing protein [Pelagophyceae sp. CCMP2097]|nr:CRAL-TRIO domain-containing protein [Pelagophyceae sp. CCMP2097]|mmetsp:Transcript_7189/g.23419  ORF Transcript_7189/g.23419 Transcript_7189/m.23419 type:complete len:312 (+) Transcript_7189:88-1023(+)
MCAAPASVVVLPVHVSPLHLESAELEAKAQELLAKVQKEGSFSELEWYYSDGAVLRRFLTARNGDVAKAQVLLSKALAWRLQRKPYRIDYTEIEMESRTGKLRVSPTLDKWGRPVVIFDNTCENTTDAQAQLRCLAFVLEHALRRVQGTDVSKYVIFMHLGCFSLANNASWAVTKETMSMLMNCFAECCGHIVLHDAPWIFNSAYRAVKQFIDPNTATKIVFVKDDVASEALMLDVLGANWRQITGAGADRQNPESSPGYRHEKDWAEVLQNDLAWRQKTQNAGPLSHVALNCALPGDEFATPKWAETGVR